MEYTPKGETKRSDAIIVGLFVLGVACFGAARLIGRYPFAAQAAGLISFSAAIYVAVRYRLTQFVYAIQTDGEDEVFAVFRDRGRNKAAQCMVSLSYLRSVKRYAERDAAKEAAAGRDVYFYTQSMSPASFVVLVFETSGERDLAVIVECDEAFERELARRAAAR